MLMKMGWAGTGTGLGSKNQGIDTPISGGEVRDRKDMYKVCGQKDKLKEHQEHNMTDL